MHLLPRPFDLIKSGEKTVEIRLNDEKRRMIAVGDTIVFTRLPDNAEKLTVTVAGLHPYPTFRELYGAVPFSDFGCGGMTMDELIESTYILYSPEREKTYGALGIRIKR